MILTCPVCAARFLVPPNAVPPSGRRVRCGKCRHEWQATAPVITGAAPDIQPIPHSVTAIPPGSNLPVISSERQDIPRARSIGLAVIAAAFVLLPFFALKLAPYMAKPAAPSAAAAEQATGVALDGVPTTMMRQEEGRQVLDIKGVLVNRSAKLEKVPVVKASALNARGRMVREWVIPLSATQLEPGQRLPFSFSTPLSDQGIEDIAFRLM